jgi:glutathione S-transferase
MSLTLYFHPLSSYCHKVLVALYENGCDFEKRLIDLGSGTDRAELQALWPFCKFPVLRDHGRDRSLAESTVIIEYLDHYFAASDPLIPADWEQALEVRYWDRILDNYVHGPMQQIVGDRLTGAGADLSKARAMLETAYGLIDRQIASRPWIAGPVFSLADCAAAPALFYASTVQALPPDMPHLGNYLERLHERPSFRRVIEEAAPYFSMYPFAQAIPERFRQSAGPSL